MTDTWEQFVNRTDDALARGMTPVLSSIYIKELRPKLVGEQLLTENSDLVGRPGLSLRIPIRSGYTYPDYYYETGMTTGIASGYTDPPYTGMGDGTGTPLVSQPEEPDTWPQIPYTDPGITWSYTDVAPVKFGHKDIVSSDLQDSANWDVIADKQECLIAGMAEFRDERIWNAILNVTEATDSNKAVSGSPLECQLAHTGVLEVTSCVLTGTATPAAYSHVDYVQGYMKFASAPATNVDITYKYTTRNFVSVDTVQELGYVDVVSANTEIRSYYGIPNTIVVDPYGGALLAKDDKMLDRDMLKTEVLLNGAIGKIAGDQVLDTHTMYTSVGVVLVSKMIGYMVYKRKLNVWKERFLYTDGDYFLATTEKSMPVITRSDLICVILNGQADAYVHA